MSVSLSDLERVVKSSSDLSGAGLATKILVSRLRREFVSDPGTLSKAVSELQAFFAKNTFAVNDLKSI